MTQLTQGQQPRLVFVHGVLDGPSAWDDLIAALGAQATGALSVTLPGMGERAGEDPPYSLERFAEEVSHQVQALKGTVVLVGHSMGAQVAELAAAQLQDTVRALVLLTPVPLAGMGMPDEAIQVFHALGGNARAQRELRSSLSRNLDAQRLEKLGQLGDLVLPTSSGALADLWNRGHAQGEQPSRYRGPVTVVRGAGDPFITAEVVAQRVQGRFEDASVEAVEGAGHWPHVEQPQAVARILAPLVGPAAVAPQGWTRAFEEKSAKSFADAFAPGMTLEASVLIKPVVGAEQVKAVMAAASSIYEALSFTHQATNGSRDYLEWEAQAFGGEKLYGITILTKNDQGMVERAAIHHRPLGAALKFSAELGRRLQGRIDPGHFFGA